MTATTKPDNRSPDHDYVFQITVREFMELKGITSTALEKCGEILVEALNAFCALGNATAADAEDDDLLLLSRVIADTGARLRTKAMELELVTEEDVGSVLAPGERFIDAVNAVWLADELLAGRKPEVLPTSCLSSRPTRTATAKPDPHGTPGTYRRGELADAIRTVRRMELAPDLDEKMEAVQHVFEVTDYVPAELRRPGSFAS